MGKRAGAGACIYRDFLRYEGLLVQVTIDVTGYEITSIITSDSTRALGLKEGVQVYALIKATEVMVIRA